MNLCDFCNKAHSENAKCRVVALRSRVIALKLQYTRRERDHEAELQAAALDKAAALRVQNKNQDEEVCFSCLFRRSSACHRHAPIDHFTWPATLNEGCGDWRKK